MESLAAHVLGIGFCNNTIGDLEKLDFTRIGMTDADKVSIIAETKALRAWHYLRLMDLYGNIPIVTKVGDPAKPFSATRKEVWEFIEKELRENVDKLQPLSQSMVGRVSKAAAYSMLAELYLNSQKWTGVQRWDECVAVCNKIIAGEGGSLKGAAPALETDIMKPFNNVNNTSPENLFQIGYNWTKGKFRFSFQGDMWHYVQFQAYNAVDRGNNGIVVIPTAYDAFADNDLRKKRWMLIDTLKKDPAFRTGGPGDSVVMATEEYKGKPWCS